MRTRLGIPSELRVDAVDGICATANAGSRIDTFPPGPRGTEQPLREPSSERQRGG